MWWRGKSDGSKEQTKAAIEADQARRQFLRAQAELQEKRPLPTGVKEFHEWADRIIAGALLTATEESQKYTLANVIVNSCGPSVAFESDAFFINYLRKSAVNQVAVAIRDEIYERKKLAQQNNGAASAPAGTNGEKALAEHPV